MQYSAPVTTKVEREDAAPPRITRSVLGRLAFMPVIGSGAPAPLATSVGRLPLVGVTCAVRAPTTGPVLLYVNTSPETAPHVGTALIVSWARTQIMWSPSTFGPRRRLLRSDARIVKLKITVVR